MWKALALLLLGLTARTWTAPNAQFQVDTIPTASGNLVITFIGHGSLVFSHGGTVVHVDPYSALGDYSRLPDADVILLTHAHPDHLDPAALKQIRTEKTKIIGPRVVAEKVTGTTVMKNGDTMTVGSLKIEAVAAYNIVNKRDNGAPFHTKGEGNGYVIGFGDRRVYVAGDTENIPEMAKLGSIDVAFLPMNLPYTMTPEMTAEAARVVRPKVLYPYHYGDTDVSKLIELLKGETGIELRIRRMQ